MIIIELMQGYYRDLDGTPKDDALTMFAQHDAKIREEHPTWSYRSPWRELEVPDGLTAPWGHEWYIVDEAGLLRLHSAQYDSSG